MRLRWLGRTRAVKQEIDEELRFHIEQRTAENIGAGMSPDEAACEVRRRFGNFQSVREKCRSLRGVSFGETTWQDVRFGLRMHWHAVIARLKPGVTLEQATAEMNTIQARIEQQYPKEFVGSQVAVVPLLEQTTGQN